MLRFITTILCIVAVFPANAQKLNETYLRARAAIQQGQYEATEREILSVPVSERTHAMYMTLGESYYSSGKYANALRSFITADSLKSSPAAELYVARTYAMMSQPAKAVAWLQKYLGQRDKLSESELQLDPAIEKIEHSKEWKTLWDKEWYSATEKRAAEATVLIKRKKYTEALAILDSEIAKYSSSANLYALRAKTYMAMEQYDPAFENYRKATQLRVNQPDYFADAAELAIRLKKYEVALDNVNQAIKLDPYRLDLYLQRAAALRMAKRYDDARKDINFYFTYLPSDTKALYQMGMAETEAGNALVGIEYFNMLIDQDKSTPDYYMARANACIQVNNYGLADDDLAQALDLNPKLPDAWLKKGIVLYQLNDIENACYYWRKALSLGSKEASEHIYKHCTPTNQQPLSSF